MGSFIRTSLFLTGITITLLYLLSTLHTSGAPYRLPHLSWISSTHKGWHRRAVEQMRRDADADALVHAQTLAGSEGFDVRREWSRLGFVVLRNAKRASDTRPGGENSGDGLVLALFEPSTTTPTSSSSSRPIAIDSLGRILPIPYETYDHLMSLARRVSLELPQSGTFRNTWKVNLNSEGHGGSRTRTSQPIDRLLFRTGSVISSRASLPSHPHAPPPPEDRDTSPSTPLTFWQTSLQGLTPQTPKNAPLLRPVKGHMVLPETMRQLFWLVDEGLESVPLSHGWDEVPDEDQRVEEEEANEEIVRGILELLGDV